MFFFYFQRVALVIRHDVYGGDCPCLRFVKYNGQPLIKIAFNAFGFLWKPRLYLWQREIEEKIIEMPDFSVETKRKNLREYFPECRRLSGFLG